MTYKSPILLLASKSCGRAKEARLLSLHTMAKQFVAPRETHCGHCAVMCCAMLCVVVVHDRRVGSDKVVCEPLTSV